MVRSIRVLSRIQVESILQDPSLSSSSSSSNKRPWVLISICTKPSEKLIGDREAKILKEKFCLYHESFFFGDYSTSQHIEYAKQHSGICFNEEIAMRMLTFITDVHNMGDKVCLAVHCDAGVSRSGAVGLFACRYLNLDEDHFRKNNPYIYPNSLVYETLYKLSGMRDNYEEWWKRDFDSNIKIKFT